MITSLYIHIDTKNKLKEIAVKNDKTLHDVIVYMLTQFVGKPKNKNKVYSTVQYQQSDVAQNWGTFTINFTPQEHECFYGCRYFFKVSVSCMLALALEMYRDIEEPVEKTFKTVYSYLPYSVKMLFCDYPQEKFWKIIWKKKKKRRKN